MRRLACSARCCKRPSVKRGDGGHAAEMFRRQLSIQDRVFNDLPTLPGVQLDLTAQQLPAIEASDLPALAAVYPPGEWEPNREDNGLRSMLNLGPRCRIAIPCLASSAMLLLRFYALAADQPYRVSLRSREGAEIASVLVARSESFLLRELLPKGCAELFIETTTLDGEPLSRPRHVRILVGRLIPVEL
jgi:hypothetical protein